jgi:transposase
MAGEIIHRVGERLHLDATANAVGLREHAYTKVVDDTKADTLMPIIRQKIKPESIVYTDCYRSYNPLDVSGFHHRRINHATERKHNHINGIENFWNQAKRVLRKHNGIPK